MALLYRQNRALPPFAAFIAFLAGAEGGEFQCDTDDPGNWTGGAKGKGDLKGTKCGISAASYPTVDIPALTWQTASPIYKRDYWDLVKGDLLPRNLAIVTADAAVNNGPRSAIRYLQEGVGANPDGQMGAQTLGAVRNIVALGGAVAENRLQLACALAISARATDDLAAREPQFFLGWEKRMIALAFYVSLP